jgi:hypothetical protein
MAKHRLSDADALTAEHELLQVVPHDLRGGLVAGRVRLDPQRLLAKGVRIDSREWLQAQDDGAILLTDRGRPDKNGVGRNRAEGWRRARRPRRAEPEPAHADIAALSQAPRSSRGR